MKIEVLDISMVLTTERLVNGKMIKYRKLRMFFNVKISTDWIFNTGDKCISDNNIEFWCLMGGSESNYSVLGNRNTDLHTFSLPKSLTLVQSNRSPTDTSQPGTIHYCPIPKV